MRYEKYFSLIVFSFLKNNYKFLYIFSISSIKYKKPTHVTHNISFNYSETLFRKVRTRTSSLGRTRQTLQCFRESSFLPSAMGETKQSKKIFFFHLESHFFIHSHLICNRYMILHWEVHLMMTIFWEHSGGQVHLQMPFCMWVLEPLHLDLLYFAQEQEKKVLKQSN